MEDLAVTDLFGAVSDLDSTSLWHVSLISYPAGREYPWNPLHELWQVGIRQSGGHQMDLHNCSRGKPDGGSREFLHIRA